MNYLDAIRVNPVISTHEYSTSDKIKKVRLFANVTELGQKGTISLNLIRSIRFSLGGPLPVVESICHLSTT